MPRKYLFIIHIIILLEIFIYLNNHYFKNNINNEKDIINITLIGISNYLRTYEHYCTKSIEKFYLNVTSDFCLCIPDELIGGKSYSIIKNVNYTINSSQPFYSNVSLGGNWKPPCQAWQKVAIIIPFRDRDQHLKILLNVLHPFLQRQQLQYTIFVIEQIFPNVFNKASLMNVGFLEANMTNKFDCFIFHDVDMLPEDDRNFYTCSDQPLHLGAFVNKFKYKLKYDQLFGGVTAFRRCQFEKVNGFSNQYYGWGGEDDDMAARLKAYNFIFERRYHAISQYSMISHREDARNPYNKMSSIGFQYRPGDYKKDGLNSIKYIISDKQLFPMYTWILVSLPLEPKYFH